MAKFQIGSSLQKEKIVEAFHAKFSASTGSSAELGSFNSHASRISVGARVLGAVEFSGSLVFAGELEGSIAAEEGNLELSKTGEIYGDIHCQVIDCRGQVFGNIHSQGKIVLRNNCKVIGDIVTQELSIQNGAQISGYCKMLEEKVDIDFFSMSIENLRKHLRNGKTIAQ